MIRYDMIPATFAVVMALRSSLCDCIKATSAFCCQSSAGCAVISTEFLRTSGLLCFRSDDVELSTETVA